MKVVEGYFTSETQVLSMLLNIVAFESLAAFTELMCIHVVRPHVITNAHDHLTVPARFSDLTSLSGVPFFASFLQQTAIMSKNLKEFTREEVKQVRFPLMDEGTFTDAQYSTARQGRRPGQYPIFATPPFHNASHTFPHPHAPLRSGSS